MTKGALKPPPRVNEQGDLSDASSAAIYTPQSSGSERSHDLPSPSISRQTSLPRLRSPNLDLQPLTSKAVAATKHAESPSEDSELYGEREDEEMETRPPLHRPTDGRSQQPLLKDEGRGRAQYESPHGSARPVFAARRSTFRSRSPDLEGSAATKKKYAIAAFFLALSLVAFVVQTETASYIQNELGWKKAYCML